MEFPSRCHHHRDNLSSCQRPHYRRGNINPKTRKKSGFTLLTMILTLSSLAHCYLPEKYPVKVYHMIQERSQYGIGRDNRIRGTWGPWSPWSDCSRTCGIGVQSQARECIQPSGLGKESVSDGINSTSLKPICIGTYKRYHICNTQECSNLSEDPRAEQCSKFNGRMYKGENYNWIPFLNAPNPCSLNCRAVGQRFYATLEPAVVDGTPCDGPNLRGKSTGFTIDQTEQWLCVAGQCKPVGCDGVIGSGAVRDSCGICGGTGSGCKLFEGIFMEPNLPRGHQPVTIIPKGAMSMNISELRYSGNFLALRAENGSYVLNGPYAVSPSGIYKVAGTILTYQRGDKHRMECITATGPLNESISLEIWYHETNPGVLYKYMLPSTDSLIAPPLYAPASNANDIPNVIPQFTPSKSITREKLPSSEQKPNQSREDVKFSPTVMAGDAPGFNSAENKNKKRKKRKFEWRIVGMTSCSKTCGGGVQNALIKCIKVDREMEVPDKRCRRFEKPQSPPAIPCNDRPCPARWRADDWSECSVTCGTGVKIRKIECVQELNSKLTMRVASGACVQPPDLSTISSCSLPACPETHFSPEVRRMMNSPRDTVPRWEVGAWSSCSSTCGKGTRNRTVTCITTREPCSQSTKPIVEKICETPCNNFSSQHHQESVWLYSEWSSKCMTECGREVETRRVACGDVSELFCNSGSRPATVKHCSANETRKCNDHAKWFTGPWSPCSVMCGEGIIRREVICIGKSSGESKILSENNCREPKPQAEEICRLSACQPEWYMSDWSECSASCGGGTKERVVRCLQDGIVAANCELSIKPREKIPCNVEVCRRDLTHKIPKSMPLNENFLKNEVYVSHKCVDEYPNCASVVKAGLCRMKYYKHSCCGCKK